MVVMLRMGGFNRKFLCFDKFEGSCQLILFSIRWAPFVYQSKGQEIAERLWQETMDELAFANVSGVIKELSG